MQLKKITTFTLLAIVLIICSLTTISAANQTISDTDTGGILQGIANTGTGETLYLNPGTYNKTNQDIMITINKNITIHGNGSRDKVIIDALGSYRIFALNNNLNVVFKNITFMNGNLNSDGGAIYYYSNTTTITVINSTFINNTAENGGAISTGGILTVIGSDFINNKATAPFARGGAIRINNIMSITDSTFINNTSIQGGAITNYIPSNLVATNFTSYIDNSIFINNTGGNGGALYHIFMNNNTNTAIYINNSMFIGNSEPYNYGGGAIHIEGQVSYININNSDFSDNSAKNMGGALLFRLYDVSYGIISTYNLDIINSTFTNNNANLSGGAICIQCPVNSNIINSNFIDNNAENYGGAIYTYYGSNTTLSNNIMAGNTAKIIGNYIYNNGTMGILNLTFIDNSTLFIRNNYTVIIYVTLTDDMGNPITGQNINFYMNGILLGTATSIEGQANLTYTVIGNDNDLIIVNGSYDGCGTYPISLYEGQIRIVKIATNSTINANNAYVNNFTNITGIITDEEGNPLANVQITLTIDGVNYNLTTNENGEWNLEYLTQSLGNIEVSITWEGNNTHYGFINTTNFNVAKRNIIVNITIEENPDGSITVIANATYEDDGNPVPNHPVDIILDDEIIETIILDENGTARTTIPANKIKNGTNNITVIVRGDENSNDGIISTSFIGTNDPNPVDPIDPINPVDPVTPNKPNNPNKPSGDDYPKKTSNNPAVKTSAAMKETGIPINIILIVLLSCLGIAIRKK